MTEIWKNKNGKSFKICLFTLSDEDDLIKDIFYFLTHLSAWLEFRFVSIKMSTTLLFLCFFFCLILNLDGSLVHNGSKRKTGTNIMPELQKIFDHSKAVQKIFQMRHCWSFQLFSFRNGIKMSENIAPLIIGLNWMKRFWENIANFDKL